MKARSICGTIVLANAAQQLTEGKPLKATPISYSEAMILARLDGRKRMTRRLVQPQPNYVNKIGVPFYPDGKGPVDYRLTPYGTEGDYLWIREEHRILKLSETEMTAKVQYRADGRAQTVTITHADLARIKQRVTPLDQWMRARFMLQSFCRSLDKVTAIRVERLQDITPEDARLEGLAGITKDDGRTTKYGIPDRDGLPGQDDAGWPWSEWCQCPVQAYAKLWESINGPGSWEANPWVWVVSFEPVINP